MIKIIRNKVNIKDLKQYTRKNFGSLVKGVVDIERELMALYGELHSDEESKLLEDGSKQENLWGINIYPDFSGEKRIEFNSMINLRPTQNNMSRGVDNKEIQEIILKIVKKLIRE